MIDTVKLSENIISPFSLNNTKKNKKVKHTWKCNFNHSTHLKLNFKIFQIALQ